MKSRIKVFRDSDEKDRNSKPRNSQEQEMYNLKCQGLNARNNMFRYRK